MPLKKYRQKRVFANTPEPDSGGRARRRSGSAAATANAANRGKLIFVVQKHAASHLHYDFRLELGGVLKSWAVPKGPSLNPVDKRLAVHVEDHPLAYAAFQGTIPAGNYGAGTVEIWDYGTYEPDFDAQPMPTGQREMEKILAEQYRRGRMHIRLNGKKLRGTFALARMHNKNSGENGDDDDAGGGKNWLLIKRREDNREKNMRIGNDKGDKAEPIPKNVKPMLTTLVAEPFDDPDWIFEIKWDGYRAIAEKDGERVRLYSRNNLDFAKRFPRVLEALEKIKHRFVLDGEVIAMNEKGKPDFQLLQQAMQDPNVVLYYYVFDLLYLDGHDLRSRPLEERRALLRQLIPAHGLIKFSQSINEKGQEFFLQAKKEKLEGIIAKKKKSPYFEGRRTKYWLKIKTELRQEAVIAGFTEPRGSRKKFGALVLGAYVNGELVYIGHTGGGFDEETLSDVYKKLQPLVVKKSPFPKVPKTNMPVTWVKPVLVCEVKFSEWTRGGQMRQPIFQGLRIDKKASEVVREVPKEVSQENPAGELDGPKNKFSNLEKIYWPKEKITKGDLINYYEKITPTLLPYIKDRPENLNRHPNGIGKPSFYQKDFVVKKLPKFARTVPIFSEHNEKEIEYLVCNNKETLLYMANLGCIEINPWNSRVQSLERPDYMVIDLDPGKNTFEEVIKVARVVHDVLELACEKNYCKTSGKTGLHIYVPLQAAYTYEHVKQFCELLVRIVHERLPDLTSLERSPAKRKNKIYLDYLQNRFGQTLCAPYSVRPEPGATVSTPLRWNEVRKGLDPKKFTIKNIFQRLKKVGDLWQPLLYEKVDLEKSIICLKKAL